VALVPSICTIISLTDLPAMKESDEYRDEDFTANEIRV
jgi:hypothetical protein